MTSHPWLASRIPYYVHRAMWLSALHVTGSPALFIIPSKGQLDLLRPLLGLEHGVAPALNKVGGCRDCSGM